MAFFVSRNEYSDRLLGSPYYNGDILSHGINTVRGSAAEALARIIESDPDRASYLRPALEKMVLDPSIAVRSCVP